MLYVILRTLISVLRSQRALAVENLALRHQLVVLQRTAKKPRLRRTDRLLWVLLCRLWTGWRGSLTIVQSETVIRWHREGFRLYWRWKSRSSRPGWPTVAQEIRDLISQMSESNPLWGAPRIHGIYGVEFVRRVEGMGVEQVVISARSPWQGPYVERLIGSIRRECLDPMIILSEKQLRRLLKSCFEYSHGSRTHLGLEKDCPVQRAVEPPDLGPVSERSMVGGLHHRYFRQAA